MSLIKEVSEWVREVWFPTDKAGPATYDFTSETIKSFNNERDIPKRD